MAMACLSEAEQRPFVLPAAKLKPPILPQCNLSIQEGILQGVCCLCGMAGVAQQREQDITALSAEVKAAYEEYDSAAEESAAAKAAWKAAEGIAGAKEVAELKGRYDALNEKEDQWKERYEELKELKEEKKHRLQAELPGAGERSPLLARRVVSSCDPPIFAHIQS